MSLHHNFEIQDVPPPRGSKVMRFLRANVLTIATVMGVIMGGILGTVLKLAKDDWTEREVMYIGFIGKTFLQMLKSLIIPLIVSCLVSAIASLDLSLSGKVAARAVAYYLTTTFASVVLGMIVVVVIAPGSGKDPIESSETIKERNTTTVDTLLDLVRNIFPPNLIEACIFQHRTLLTQRENDSSDVYTWKIDTETIAGTNIMGLVVASAAIGIALAQLGEETRTMTLFFQNLLTMMMKITSWVIAISPLGVMFLVTGEILKMENPKQAVSQLGFYFLTVCIGLGIQGFIVLPILYIALTRRNPFVYIKELGPALATAFGTASSTATLPLTVRCLEERLHIDPRIARFTLPIGSTINMDGTALYEAVAAIFIAQVRKVDLGIGRLIAISITATAASIGAAGIPQAGLVTMVMVLETVGLPAQDVTMILAVDWLLDRFRTTVNVMGDAFGSGVVHYRSQKELQEIESRQLAKEKENHAETQEKD